MGEAPVDSDSDLSAGASFFFHHGFGWLGERRFFDLTGPRSHRMSDVVEATTDTLTRSFSSGRGHPEVQTSHRCRMTCYPALHESEQAGGAQGSS